MSGEIEAFEKALGIKPFDVRCEKCGASETIFEVDEPFDEAFLANYLCSNCDGGEEG